MIRRANNEITNEYIIVLEERLERMRAKVKRLREIVWLSDVPHPKSPEYIELHEKMQRIINFIDTEMLGGEDQ